MTEETYPPCDKCGKSVEPANDASLLDYLVRHSCLPPSLHVIKARHLYPVGDCEGSPSRVRLVTTDKAWTAAYQRLTQTAGAEDKPA